MDVMLEDVMDCVVYHGMCYGCVDRPTWKN